MAKDSRYFGEEIGPFEVRCRECGKYFNAPTAYALYCRGCRVRVISALPLSGQKRRPVLLDCERNPSCGMWVEHVFVRCEDDGDSKDTSIKIIYGCKKCGHERLFGLEEQQCDTKSNQ